MTRAAIAKWAGISLALSFVCLRQAAGDPVVQVITQNNTVTTPQTSPATYGNLFVNRYLGGGQRALPPNFHGSLGLNAGYDDNASEVAGGGGSATAGAVANLSYSSKIGRASINLIGVFGYTRYLDSSSGRTSDFNLSTSLGVNYPVSKRLNLSGNVSASYQSRPDLATDLGLNRRAGNFVQLDAGFAASYRWSLRLSTVSSYSFRPVQYDDGTSGVSQNRIEQSFGQSLNYRLSVRTSLLADYRISLVNYETAPLDSVTHTVLAGADYRVSKNVTAVATAGATFRSYDTGPIRTDPHFEGTLSYAATRRASFNLNVGYSIEEPDTTLASSRVTFRTGLSASYLITWRITGTASVNYHHDENDNSLPGFVNTGSSSFSQDAIDLSVGLQYVINRRFSLTANYSRSQVLDDDSLLAFTRNSYSLGLRVNF